MRNSLRKRLAVALLLSLVGIVGLMYAMMSWTLYQERMEALVDSMQLQNRDIAQMLESRSQNSLFWFFGAYEDSVLTLKISELKRTYGAEIWYVQRQGYVESLSGQSALPLLDSEAAIAFLQKVHSGQESHSFGLFPSLGRQVVTLGAPVMDGQGGVTGALLMHVSTASVRVDYTKMATQMSWVVLALILLEMILFFWVSRYQYGPLDEMKKAVLEFAAGNLKRRVEAQGQGDLAELSQAFNQMAEDISKLEEVRRDFVASVSHELRSPMTSIQGYIQGMLDGTIADMERPRYLGVVLEETRRLNQLVSDLLDLSRIESGKLPLNQVRFDINELIRRVLIGFERRIDEKQIQVEVVFRQDICFVYADRERIAQVLYNLIDNAVKFCRKGDTLSIWTHAAQDLCYVTVKDGGPGIDPADLPYIFESFYKGDKAHTSGMGTGLGLSIVKKILTQHGQAIRASSIPGRGTSMHFTLAVEEQQTPLIPGPGAPEPGANGEADGPDREEISNA